LAGNDTAALPVRALRKADLSARRVEPRTTMTHDRTAHAPRAVALEPPAAVRPARRATATVDANPHDPP